LLGDGKQADGRGGPPAGANCDAACPGRGRAGAKELEDAAETPPPPPPPPPLAATVSADPYTTKGGGGGGGVAGLGKKERSNGFRPAGESRGARPRPADVVRRQEHLLAQAGGARPSAECGSIDGLRSTAFALRGTQHSAR